MASIKESEAWAPVEGFDGSYLVSTWGNIFSVGDPNDKRKRNKVLKKYVDRYGYHKVVLYKNKKAHYLTIHRLVGKAFVPNPDGKPQINHIDGDKLNNTKSNLEWSTPSENKQHAYDTGLTVAVRGEKCGQSKLRSADVVDIRLQHKNGSKQSVLAKKYGVDQSHISDIVNRHRWAHL